MEKSLTEHTNTLSGLGDKPEENVIQKSLPLFQFTKNSLTMLELKILDIYLSRINSKQPKNDSVIITKKELEHSLKIDKLNALDVLKGLQNLLSKTILCDIKDLMNPNAILTVDEVKKIDEQMEGDGILLDRIEKVLNKEVVFDYFPLFKRARLHVKYNKNKKTYDIILQCSDIAKDYIFNVEGIKYIRYKLRNILKLTSKYSYNLFMYLEQNKFRKKWTVSIEDLRKVLGCTTKSYEAFKLFNQKVLQPAIKNVNTDTERNFNYRFIKEKKSKEIKYVEFDIIFNKYIEYNYLQEDEEVYDLEYIFKKEKYAQTEIDLIQKELLEISIPKLMEYIPQDMDKDNIDIKTMQYFYAKHCYNILEKQKGKKEIANELKYYLTILKNNYKDKKEDVKKEENE